jgi:O-antigen ligase
MKGKYGTRYMLTRDTWAMFTVKPIYGWGLGAYENVFNYYNGAGFKGVDHASQHFYVFAHNDILQTLSELGLIGCTILGIPVILFYFGKIRFANLSSEIIWLLFVDALVIGYSLIEFPLRCPLILVILVLVNSNIVAYYSVNKGHITSSS